MSESLVRNALQSIPGWEHASWQVLEGGQTNASFLIEFGGRRAVLKIDDAPRTTPFNSRPDEAEIQSLAFERGIATRVLHASECVYLSEFVAGTVWNADDLFDPQNLLRLANRLKKLHAMPLTGRIYDPIFAAEQYANKVSREKTDEAARHLAVVRQADPGGARVCCHNDLVAENILLTDYIRFLDWEYACDNTPLFDLATIISHHGLPDTLASMLLNAYFGDDIVDDTGNMHEALAEQRRLYESLRWLWTACRQV